MHGIISIVLSIIIDFEWLAVPCMVISIQHGEQFNVYPQFKGIIRSCTYTCDVFSRVMHDVMFKIVVEKSNSLIILYILMDTAGYICDTNIIRNPLLISTCY